MNKNDIGRMVSLADERYVNEMLEERIVLNGRKRNVFTGFAAMAAAMAVVIGGIWCFANTKENIDEPVTPFVSEQPTVADNSGVQPFDYAELFKNKLDEEPSDILKEDIVIHSIFTPDGGYSTGSKKAVFGDEYTKALMPFDAEYFNYSETEFYYDGEDSVKFILVRLGKNLNDNKDKMCRITVCREGELLSKMNLDGYASTERLGAEVYGFELNWRSDSNKAAVFAANGFEYQVESVLNMTYDELGIIIDALIQKGISVSDFDVFMGQLTEGSYGKKLTLAEANATAPFAGYIPQSARIGGMELDGVSYGESSQNSIVDYKYINVSYIREEPYNYIFLSYGTSGEDPMTSVPLDNILYKFDGFAQPTDTNGVFSYTFAVECGEFRIKVWAKCTPEEMEQCLKEISGNSEQVGGEQITLAEANSDEPFIGFVPQVEKVGDMELAYVTRDRGNIVLDYSFNDENRFSYIKLTYTKDKNVPSNYAIIKLEDLTDKNIVINRYDGADGRYNYKFAVDCSGRFYVCIDCENCTTAELYDCILTQLMDNQKRIEEERSKLHAEKEEQERKLAEQNALFERILKGGDEAFTLEKVKKLAEKGDNLDWSDFENFSGTEVGSGLFIMAYNVENTDYWVHVGGVPGEKPWYVYLSKSEDWDKRIDIRYDSVDDFLRDKTLTMEKVRELAKKGDDLMWDDFDGYNFTEGGSGLYIRSYVVEGGYNLMIGGDGSLADKPMYIYLGGKGKRIDIRYDSIDEFLS